MQRSLAGIRLRSDIQKLILAVPHKLPIVVQPFSCTCLSHALQCQLALDHLSLLVAENGGVGLAKSLGVLELED